MISSLLPTRHFFYLLILMLAGMSVQAADPIRVPITIQGAVYSAELQENSALLGKLGGSGNAPLAKHYMGSLIDVAGSWVRASNIDGQWQGIVSIGGSLHIIDSGASAQVRQSASASATRLISTPVAEFADQMKGCGVVDAPGSTPLLFEISAEAPVGEVSFPTFCADQVNGVCLIAELELIFDVAFQNMFGAQAGAQAISLINIAEAYFLNDMNMAFDAITIELLTSDIFTASTDSSALLNDMLNKKVTAGQIPFLKNNSALTHLVTGRNFDGSVAGIAFINSVCETNYSVGTSSVVGQGSIPLTALVVTHELGHNFGARHDGTNTCPSTGFIMAPSLNASVTRFSSCSVSEMQNQIDTATNSFGASSCFNFPADAGIVADGGNPASVNRGDPFASLYNLSLANGYQPVAQLLVQGAITASGGVLNSVTANGSACTVSGSLSYSCTVNNPAASLALSVQGNANGTANQLQLTHTVSVQGADVRDLTAANDQLVETIAITDPQPPGITVVQGAGLTTSEVGGAASFTVVLDSQPADTVTINLTSSDTTEGAVSPATLSFTTSDWNSVRTVSVTGIDDSVDDGDIDYNVSFEVQSTDAAYNGFAVPAVLLTNLDNDLPPGITVYPISSDTTSEDGATASFNIVLDSQPTGPVIIKIISSDESEGAASPTSITFFTTTWSAVRNVTISGVDDTVDDGDIVYNVSFDVQSEDPAYNGFSLSAFNITNLDNDLTPGVTVSPSGGLTTSELGATDSFTVVLESPPFNPVTIYLSSSNTNEGTVSPSVLSFTADNWSTAQSVTVTGVDDNVVDGTIGYTIGFDVQSPDANYAGFTVPSVTVNNLDNDVPPPPGVIILPNSGLVTSEAAGTATFTVLLASQPSDIVTFTLTSSDTSEGTVSPSIFNITPDNWNYSRTVTVTGVNDDMLDGTVGYSIQFTVQSADANYDGFAVPEVIVSNTDDEVPLPPGITLLQDKELVTSEDGLEAVFTIVLDTMPTNIVTIDVISSNTAEGTVKPNTFDFTTENWNGDRTITITGVDDDVVDGDVAFEVSFTVQSTDTNYNGFAIPAVAVTNQDNDTAQTDGKPNTNNSLDEEEAGGLDWWWLISFGLLIVVRKRDTFIKVAI